MQPEIYFSQIREDSLVERQISAKYQPRNVVVIGSGGCTAFSILNKHVDVVYCVDLNPAQCALIELKKAALLHLERDEFLAFVGEKPSDSRLAMYTRLSKQLPDYAQAYWANHAEALKLGSNQCGVTERFYRFIGQNIRKNVYADEIWEQLFQCETLTEQKEFYTTYLTTDSWKTAMRILLSKTTHLQFFPSFMFAQAAEHDFGLFFAQQFEQELHHKIVKQNYFLRQLLFATYLENEEEGYPYYLSETGYELVKKNLHKLTVVCQPIQLFLRETTKIDAFYLSNIFDWANEREREEICWAVLQAKAAQATILYRNMLARPSLPSFFMEALEIDTSFSQRLLTLERSMMYQQITCGELR